MDCYERMYLHLFNRVTDAARLLPADPAAALQILVNAQADGEEIFIGWEDKRERSVLPEGR